MELKNEAFHLLRQLFQQHTARWQLELPDLTKPQYAVMRSIAEHPGIEQVTLTEAAVSTKATLAEMLSRMESRGLVPLGHAVDEEFLGRLSDEERQQFSQIIHKLMAQEQQR